MSILLPPAQGSALVLMSSDGSLGAERRVDSRLQMHSDLISLLTSQKRALSFTATHWGILKPLLDVLRRGENQSRDTEGGPWEDTEMMAFLSHKCAWLLEYTLGIFSE